MNPRLGNFRVADVHPFKRGETVKVFQTCVCNLNAVKIQNLDFRQPLEVADTRVSYFGAETKVEISKIGQPSQILKTRVRDSRVIKGQGFEFG